MSRQGRQNPGDEDYEFSEQDYQEDKKMCEERSGYPEITGHQPTDEEIAQKAVSEKLPSGSKSY
jgi:hypothetical protein